MPVTATAAVGLAAALDAAVGEPPVSVHPVAWLGTVVDWLDREWPAPRFAGFVLAMGLPIAVAVVAGGIALGAEAVDPWIGAVAAGLVLFVSISLRMLLSEARAVVAATEHDLGTARDRLGALAGRDPTTLSPGEVRSAAVESLAENLADGLVAPLTAFALGAAVGGLSLAAAAAAWTKAVDTLDSMLGYPDRPLGWASARQDDVAMFLPALASAGLLGLVALAPGALPRAREGAATPSSPNAGWPMATAATLLDRELRKPGAYVLNEGAGLPSAADARRARTLVGRAGAAAVLLAGVVAWA